LTLKPRAPCPLLTVYLTKYGITFKVVAGKIPMVDLSFFNKSKEHSVIKAEIVSRYLSVWAQVMCSRSPKALYVDLFAGPGRYADCDSTSISLATEQEH